MKIALLGAKGFIGRPLVAAVRAHHELQAWDLPDVDILDQKGIIEHLRAFAPDVVVNLAAVLGGMNSKNVSEILTVNFWGNHGLVETCRELGIRRFVFASSLTVHGENDRDHPQSPDAPFRPKHPYAASKAAAEFALMQYAKLGMTVVALRPTLILGDTPVNHAPIEFISSLLAGKDIELYGMGDHEREWIWIDDAVDGFSRAVELATHAEPGYYPFFLSGNRISMRDLAEKCAKRLNGTVRLVPSNAKAFTLTADASETERVLGWRPTFDIDAMIEKLIPIVKQRAA